MDRAAIVDKLTAIFQDVFDDETIVLRDDMTSADIEHWDSVNQIMILIACEVAFKIKFATVETEGLRDVGELIAVIEKKTA
ncbi:MAG TPA: acyl carrier protein [Novosphingobium sp.]